MFAARVDRLIARFTAALVARAAALGSDDATPIVIVGLPRSGTTLVEQILSADPDVSGGGELPYWNERSRAWDQAGPAGTEAAFLGTAADYLRRLRSVAPDAARVTDQMLLNFQWAGLITIKPSSLTGERVFLQVRRRSGLDTACRCTQTQSRGNFSDHSAARRLR
jgi:hypothetical protein